MGNGNVSSDRKRLKSRIQHKYAIPNDWKIATLNGFKPLEGEFILINNNIRKSDSSVEAKEPSIVVGDGIHTIEELKKIGSSALDDAKNYADSLHPNVFLGEDISIDELNAPNKKDGDFAIISNKISENHISYTAYIYNNNKWQALDGNYNAENVYFADNMMVTTNIGYIDISNGRGTIPSKDKNLMEVFEAMFVMEEKPTKTDPSVSVTLTGAGSYEVGTKVTGVNYSASFKDGSYTYGPEPTGVVPTKWKITAKDGYSATVVYSNTITPAEGETAVADSILNVNLDDVTVTDDTNFTVTAEAQHTEGAIPKTNTGNDCTDLSKKITEGTKSNISDAIKGYRNFFYGSMITAIDDLNSANIRQYLIRSERAVGTSQTFNMSIDEGAKQVIIAFPTNTGKTLSKVLDANAFNTNIVGSFVKSTVEVKGAGDSTAIDYDVWVYTPATALGANTYSVTIA